MAFRAIPTTLLMECALAPAVCGGGSSASSDVARKPADIATIMAKPHYTSANATWSPVVMDAKTGEVVHDRLSLTSSVRKLFSACATLDTLGPDHRLETGVYRTGAAPQQGALVGTWCWSPPVT